MTEKYKDYHIFILLFIITFISIYFLPVSINRVIFLLILFAIARTNRDYVYLAWFFLINDAPGRLFSATAFDAARIPLYPIIPGFSISFQELFILFYIFKLLSMKKTYKFVFKKEFRLFISIGLFVVLYSIPFGMNFTNMIKTFRLLLPWALLFIIPAYINNRKIMIRTSLLLFPLVFLALFSQIFSYLTGNYLDNFLRGTQFSLFSNQEESVSRSYSALYITLFVIVQSLYFLFSRRSDFNQNYLVLLVFVGYFSILLTATRGWIVALSFLFLAAFFLSILAGTMTKWLRIVIIFSAVFWVATSQSTLIKKQVDSSFKRLSTLEDLAAGDITAGGTLRRLDLRSPRVMGKFWESPIVGWGFSNEFFEYNDEHVGNQSILLNVGILGFVFVNGLFIWLCFKIWRRTRNREIRKAEGIAPLIYFFGLITVFVIHSSSSQLWGYSLVLDKILLLSFIFTSASAVLQYPSGLINKYYFKTNLNL